MFISSESSERGLREMERIDFMSKGASNQVDWRVGMVVDMVVKVDPTLGGRSTFLTKREC
jgi:hypothetical protein